MPAAVPADERLMLDRGRIPIAPNSHSIRPGTLAILRGAAQTIASASGIRIPALIGVLLLLGVGCATLPRAPRFSPKVRLFVGTSLEELRLGDRIELNGAVNEVLSFAVAVAMDQGTIERPTWTMETLSGGSDRLPASVLRPYRVHSVEGGRRPGWHLRTFGGGEWEREIPDVLVPVDAPQGGMPERMAAGERFLFWFDVSIPKGSAAGTYAGALTLLGGGTPATFLNLEIRVHSFVMPEENEITLLAELDHESLVAAYVRGIEGEARVGESPSGDRPDFPRIHALLDETGTWLREHRVTPAFAALRPRTQLGADGRPKLDWSGYDAFLQSLWGGTIPSGKQGSKWIALPPPEESVLEAISDGGGGAAALRWLSTYLPACAQHFQDRGWSEQAYLPLSRSASLDLDAIERRERALLDIARESNPRPMIMSHLFPQDLAPVGWPGDGRFAPGDGVSIWSPPARYFDREVMAAERGAGRRTWLALDRPPFSGATSRRSPASFQRVIPWQARRLGAEVVELGMIHGAEVAGTSSTRAAKKETNTDPLFYSGVPYGLGRPVASVRLKNLRRGQQDAVLLSLLDRQGLGHLAEALQSALVSHAGSGASRAHHSDPRPLGWPTREDAFEDARTIANEALDRQARGEQAGAMDRDLATDVRWRRLMSAARGVDLTIEGVRVQPSPTVRSASWEAEVAVVVTNRRRVPLGGGVRVSKWPPGWTPLDGERAIDALGPLQSLSLRFRAQVEPVVTGVLGGAPLEVELRDDTGTPRVASFRAAVAAPLPAPGALVIDGDLGDWPAGDVNLLSDFTLVASGGAFGAEGLERRPRHATTGFVLRDRENLYVAISAMSPGGRIAEERSGNQVRYEDLVPVGEELIEILIDPLNAGTRSPDDLLHIVVKASGAVLVEQGVAMRPPISFPHTWSARVEAATRREADRWTAEVRIPLASLGTQRGTTVWGFNVLRMNASAEEYSSWSAAFGNAYDPMTLGNLILP